MVQEAWVLIIWIATAFLAYTAIGNYPLNILKDFYGGQEKLSMITKVFTVIAVAGVVSVILMLLFSAAHVKEKDDEYRKAAGKPLDDALVGRK